MYSYNIMEWLIFFYIYCFLGWVWECLYVSVCKAKWVNRGFMHGPFLPIYGTGATVMLFLTIPVKESIVMTFIIGMIGATILEFVTGAAMEKIFGVRYWDYSDCFLNFHGHICLKASLLWGVFSVLLIHTFHMPIEKLVKSFSFTFLQIVAIVLTAIFSADFSASFREALDLKELLINLTESNEELRKIEKRLEVVTSAISNEVKEVSTGKLIQLNKALENNRQKVLAYKERMGDKKASAKLITRKLLIRNLSSRDKAHRDFVNSMIEKINLYTDRLREEEHQENTAKHRQTLQELEHFKSALERHKPRTRPENIASYMRLMRLLRRNPDAVSGRYHEALRELSALDDVGDNKECERNCKS